MKLRINLPDRYVDLLDRLVTDARQVTKRASRSSVLFSLIDSGTVQPSKMAIKLRAEGEFVHLGKTVKVGQLHPYPLDAEESKGPLTVELGTRLPAQVDDACAMTALSFACIDKPFPFDTCYEWLCEALKEHIVEAISGLNRPTQADVDANLEPEHPPEKTATSAASPLNTSLT